MRWASEARTTCWASRSGSEYTATDAIPSSSSARMTRTAISPRFATRTLLNMRRGMLVVPGVSDRLVIVRHGESTWNAEKRLQGQLDPPLSDQGRTQVRELAAAFDFSGYPPE